MYTLKSCLYVLLVLLMGAASSYCQTLFQMAPSYAAGVQPWGEAAADFNGDGTLDVITADYGSNSIVVFLGNGDGTLQSAIATNVGGRTQNLATADFNGDGHIDAAVGYVDGTFAVLFGHGDGTFAAPVSHSTPGTAYTFATGDLNGDGVPDLAVADFLEIAVFLNHGDGTFSNPVLYPAGTQPAWVTLADLNSDGIPDLAVGDYQSGVSVLLGNGNGTFQTAGTYSFGGGSS